MAGPSNQVTYLDHRRYVDRTILRKLQLDENIAAYMERKHLIRDEHIPSWYDEDNNLERVVTNYVIAKEILSNVKWQDKLVYRHVCSVWNSAVIILRQRQLSPVDFIMKYNVVTQSSTFTTEPLAVFSFVNKKFPNISNSKYCSTIIPRCCTPLCDKGHISIDIIHKLTTAPKECMMGVTVPTVMFLPLPHSITEALSVGSSQTPGFIGGIFIPSIPNVKFHKINLKNAEYMAQEFCTAIDDIVIDQVIKGLLVFVTDRFLEESDIDEIEFLNHIKQVQPNIPYAMGGCMCEDTILGTRDINSCIERSPVGSNSGNLISVGVFTIPKDKVNETKFGMFSYIVESTALEKDQIRASIARFSISVPHYKHSVCFMLACVGRDKTYTFEQHTFRSFFPTTYIVGCCGVGEIGINSPSMPSYEPPKKSPKMSLYATRKEFTDPHQGLLHSYATVFVYMGWGTITTPAVAVE